MPRFYITFRLSEAPLHCSFLAKDVAHALQRLTDFIAGYNWEKASKSELHIESISIFPKRGIDYREDWL